MVENKWSEFYSPFFLTAEDTRRFVEDCQSNKPSTPKLIIYQTQRLISLSDEMPKLRPGRESLQVLFLLICAEHVAKLAAGYQDERESRRFTKEFFTKYGSVEDLSTIRTGFTTFAHQPLTVEAAIDALYDVRCDVVHEGNYWGFTFRMGDVGMLNQDPDLIAQITVTQFRDVVVRCAIRAATSCLQTRAA